MRQDTLDQGSWDAVDRIVAQWRRERPDLDASGKEITGRIVRLAILLQRRYAEAFAPIGLNDGDYGVLAALRRSGEPFELTPTDLARTQMMTSGGMTAAIDRLERKSLVERVPNPHDRRGSLVKFTSQGRDVIDRAMELHVDAERAFVGALSPAERGNLVEALRNLLVAVDDA